MSRALAMKMILNLLEHVTDLEGLLKVVQQYAAEDMNRRR